MKMPTDPKQRERMQAALLAERARRDVNAFAEFVMVDQAGRPWRQEPFHRQWQDLIPCQGPAKVLIGAPREFAKTSQMIARILWELGTNPELRVKVVSATAELADNIVGEIQRHIQQNPRVRLVFPRLRPDPKGPWSRGELLVHRTNLAKDPSVVAAGALGSGVGGRADLIIFDDVCDQRNAILQPAMREQIKATFHETWENLLGPDGRAVHIATVWHVDDLTMELRRGGAWQVWWRPARDPVNGELLWPERWTAEALARREREIGARSFARQFLLQPVSDEERTFPQVALQACLDDQVAPGQLLVPDDWPRYAGVDLAASLGQKASWTVMLTAAVDPESKRRHLLEIVRARQPFPDTIQMIRSQWEKTDTVSSSWRATASSRRCWISYRGRTAASPLRASTRAPRSTTRRWGSPRCPRAWRTGPGASPPAAIPAPRGASAAGARWCGSCSCTLTASTATASWRCGSVSWRRGKR